MDSKTKVQSVQLGKTLGLTKVPITETPWSMPRTLLKVFGGWWWCGCGAYVVVWEWVQCSPLVPSLSLSLDQAEQQVLSLKCSAWKCFLSLVLSGYFRVPNKYWVLIKFWVRKWLYGSKQLLDPKKFYVHKNFGSKKLIGPKDCGSKNISF